MNYNEKLDTLFKEWESEALNKGFTKFCRDGLLYKGKIWNVEKNNKIYWGRNTDSASISFKNDGDGDTNDTI